MKVSIPSRVLDFVGRRMIGDPTALFGTPPGALDQLYIIRHDRGGYEALDPGTVHDAAWLRHQAATILLRRNLQYRIGIAVSAVVLPVVFAGLLLAGGISLSTSGLRASWAAHEAQVAQADAQAQQAKKLAAAKAEQAKEEAAEQAKQAAQAKQIDAIVAQYAQQCAQMVANGGGTLTPAQIASVSGHGCDTTTGKITLPNIAREAAQMQLEGVDQ